MNGPENPPGGHVTGVVAALRSEARCLSRRPRGQARAGLLVQTSGMGCQRAARTAHELVRSGAGALLCWGVAGALDPALRCGDVLLASEVICASALALQLPNVRPIAVPAQARVRTSESWRSELARDLQRHGPILQAPLLTSAELVCEPQQKARLFRETGAVAVDMESAAVGVVARLHGVPFLALRVIADTALDEMPPMLRLLADSQPLGAFSWISWLPVVCLPSSWPGLARLGRRYRAATRVLRQCAQWGHPGRGRGASAT